MLFEKKKFNIYYIFGAKIEEVCGTVKMSGGIFRSSPFLVTTYDDFINSFLVPDPIITVNINHFAGFLIPQNDVKIEKVPE